MIGERLEYVVTTTARYKVNAAFGPLVRFDLHYT